MQARRHEWPSAGQAAAHRCEAIGSIDEASVQRVKFEEEVQQFIPRPGSSKESPQLRRLRDIQAKKSQTSDGHGEGKQSFDPPHNPNGPTRRVTWERGADGEKVETELYWSAKRLIWSRAGVLVRSFTYEEEIKSACWAWMDSGSTWEEKQTPSPAQTNRQPNGGNDDRKPAIDDSGTVSQLQFCAKQTPSMTTEASKAKKKQKSRPIRTLCVFLPSCFVLYHPHSGQEYIKRLDLTVLNVFPLSVGLLIQRNVEGEDQRRAQLVRQGVAGADAPLSTLFYLRRPFDELEEVECVDGILFTRHASSMRLSARVQQREEQNSRVFNEVDERVVFVSSTIPLLVSASEQGKSIRIYAYSHEQAPFPKFQAGKKESSTTEERDSAGNKVPRLSSVAMSRRATMDGQRSRSGARPRLPPRKSARLESSSSRSSMGGPRSSMGGERSRTLSGSGHTRRISAGLTSVYNQSALLQGEEEQGDGEEENVQGMMQLLDEFDEVEEENGRLASVSGQQARAGAPMRRRTSRAFASTSAAPPALPTTRTPFAKARPTEERRVSRARMSMPAGIATDRNAVSLAMELSQKDEASKLALNANGDKGMAKGLSGDGREGEDQTPADGLPVFRGFARGFAAMVLLEEIAVPELQSTRQAASAKAFIQQEGDATFLYLVLPFCSKLLCRQIVESASREHPLSFTYASQVPSAHPVDCEVQAADAFVVHSKNRQDVVLVEPATQNSSSSSSGLLLVGPPGPSSARARVELGRRGEEWPLHVASHGSRPLTFKTEPHCRLTAKVMDACKMVLSSSHFGQLRADWLQSQPKEASQEWVNLVDLLLWGLVQQRSEERLGLGTNLMHSSPTHHARFAHLLTPFGETGGEVKQESQVPRRATPGVRWTDVELAGLVEALGLIGQDARLDVCERTRDVPKVARLIIALSTRLGWWDWFDYWARLAPGAVEGLGVERGKEAGKIASKAVFDVYDQANMAMRGGPVQRPRLDLLLLFARLQTVLEVLSSFSEPAPTFETMSDQQVSLPGRTAKAVVDRMLKVKMGSVELNRLPFSLALPLQQARKVCQREPPSEWSSEAYLFVGREDLASKVASHKPSDDKAASPCLATSDVAPSRLFPFDYRLKEVVEMLQTSRPIATRGPDVASAEDQELVADQQKRVFVSASDRIKSLSVGRAMLSLSSVGFKGTEQWKTAPICLRIRMLNNCIIQHREPDPEGPEMEWPEFHNGVASALQLDIRQDKIESSWLYSQLNREFTSRHAGLMFGVGMLGQLRQLGKTHAHYYFTNRHPITTIGLLLGISLSFVGSCDGLVKSLISLHLSHTLPVHGRPLKTSMLEQSAALVALGLLSMASKDRWASRMAFKAIGAESVMTEESQMAKRECYSLSAALSLGLTCLGKGREASLGGELEREIIPSLEHLIKRFSSDILSEEQQQRDRIEDEKRYSSFEWKPEVSLTTTPASIALALIYLKSNRKDKLDKLALPDSAAQLDKIRPDELLLRAICRGLIAWDDIQPTLAWLQTTLPAFLRFGSVKEVREAGEGSQMAYWSLRLGSLFALGLKYAGSNDAMARACLMAELIYFQSQLDVRPNGYFDKVRQQTLQSSVDVILSCLSMVLAGTGDVEVLQYLRKSLYRVDTLRYGNYMATSMSIGMLFLGEGRFTLSTSDSAIAALLISFYPRYPINAQDNRSHLQAYRHLWLTAVEARLLSVKDVQSGESSRMDVQVAISGKSDPLTLSTPSLLPRLEQVESISVVSPRYFASTLDLRRNAGHRRTVVETRKVHVKKRAAELSHDQDKWGKSSIGARTKGLVVGTQLPIATSPSRQQDRWRGTAQVERREQIKQLRTLIAENTNDTDICALLQIASGGGGAVPDEGEEDKEGGRVANEQESSLELFILQSILHCLLHDSEDVLLPSLLYLFSSTQAVLDRDDKIESGSRQGQICFLTDLRFLQSAQLALTHPSHPPLLDCKLVDSLAAMVRTKVEGVVPETTLRSYARLDLPHHSPWDQDDDDGTRPSHPHSLASLLVASHVPSLPTLVELKQMAMQSRDSGAIKKLEVMQTLTRSVLAQAGFDISTHVVDVFVQTWWQS